MGQDERRPKLFLKVVSAGFSGCLAEVSTYPLDTARVRLQLDKSSDHDLLKSKRVKYIGMLQTLRSIYKQEGIKSFFRGIMVALQRQVAFTAVRLGLYDSFKYFYHVNLLYYPKPISNDQYSILARILAAGSTGFLAVIIGQPTDIIKVRLQAGKDQSSRKAYKGSWNAFKIIVKEEGFFALWKGVNVNIIRSGLMNITDLVTYEKLKEYLIFYGNFTDDIPCHFVSGIGSGIFCTAVANPIEVCRTRFMNDSQQVYKSAFHCGIKTFKDEGVLAFYKGLLPTVVRIVPWNAIMFISYEQLKKFLDI